MAQVPWPFMDMILVFAEYSAYTNCRNVPNKNKILFIFRIYRFSWLSCIRSKIITSETRAGLISTQDLVDNLLQFVAFARLDSSLLQFMVQIPAEEIVEHACHIHSRRENAIQTIYVMMAILHPAMRKRWLESTQRNKIYCANKVANGFGCLNASSRWSFDTQLDLRIYYHRRSTLQPSSSPAPTTSGTNHLPDLVGMQFDCYTPKVQHCILNRELLNRSVPCSDDSSVVGLLHRRMTFLLTARPKKVQLRVIVSTIIDFNATGRPSGCHRIEEQCPMSRHSSQLYSIQSFTMLHKSRDIQDQAPLSGVQEHGIPLFAGWNDPIFNRTK